MPQQHRDTTTYISRLEATSQREEAAAITRLFTCPACARATTAFNVLEVSNKAGRTGRKKEMQKVYIVGKLMYI